VNFKTYFGSAQFDTWHTWIQPLITPHNSPATRHLYHQASLNYSCWAINFYNHVIIINHNQTFKVNSAQHCSHCTEKTKDQEEKEKRDICWTVWSHHTTRKQRQVYISNNNNNFISQIRNMQ